MRKLTLRLLLAAMACLGLVTLGCTPPAAVETPTTIKPPMAADDLEHAHEAGHVHAETYAEAVAQVVALRNEIRDAFGKGEGASADNAVHEVGHALEDMTALAEKASLSKEDQVAVATAVESLLDAFGKVDEKLHGGDGVDYDKVTTEIDTAFETLQKFTGESK